MQKTILIVFLFFYIHINVKAQSKSFSVTPSTLNIGGGSATIVPNFYLDWSIGESTVTETYYLTNANPNLIIGSEWSVTSGVLQPFDNTHVIFSSQIPLWTMEEIHLYPVPSHNIIYIDFRSTITGRISMKLFSRDGKLLHIKEFDQINGTSTQKWDLSNVSSGLYYIQITLTAYNGDILKQGTFNLEKL